MRTEAKHTSLVPTIAAVAAAGVAPVLALGVLFTTPNAMSDNGVQVTTAATSSVVAMPTGCTNLSGGSGSPNNGSHPGGTGTGAGAGNFTGGMLGGGAAELGTACCGGGSAADEVHSAACHSGNVGGYGGRGVPAHLA